MRCDERVHNNYSNEHNVCDLILMLYEEAEEATRRCGWHLY